MTHSDLDRPDLSPDDAAFVRRVVELSKAPEQTVQRRTVFQAKLNWSLNTRRRAVRWPALVGALATAATMFFVFRAGMNDPVGGEPAAGVRAVVPQLTAAQSGLGPTPVEALFLLSREAEEADLPGDYLAIENLMFGG